MANKWNRLLLALAVVAVAAGDPTWAQTTEPVSAEPSYSGSTYLLLFIHVLIILVVVVICITGVLMFCLSSMTESEGDTRRTSSEGTLPCPKTQVHVHRDLPYFKDITQELASSETVKLKAEDSLSDEVDDGHFERVVLIHKRENDSVSVELEDAKEINDIRIQLEPCKELLPSPDNKKVSHTSLGHLRHADRNGLSEMLRSQPMMRFGALAASGSLVMSPPSKLDYFRPQGAAQAVGVRG